MLSDLVYVVLLVVVLAAGILLQGCAPKEVVVDRYIHTNCNIILPDKPSYTGFEPEDVRELVKHTRNLECLLEFCKEGKFSTNCKGVANEQGK